MILPSFLNNLTKGQNNSSPNSIQQSTMETPSRMAVTNATGVQGLFGNPTLDAATKLFATQRPQQPVTQPQVQQPIEQPQTQVSPDSYVNPLNQYNPNFGQAYANQNLGGYNPIAEYHKLQQEAAQKAIRQEGPYSLPEGVPAGPEDVARANSIGDQYYQNMLAKTAGESQQMLFNLKNGYVGGELSKYTPTVANQMIQYGDDFNKLPEVQMMKIVQNSDINAKNLQKELVTRPANGSDDMRLINLFVNSINPNSVVSEGEFANGKQMLSTLPASVQQSISRIAKIDPATGNLVISKMPNSMLTREGINDIVSAIHEHSLSNIQNYNYSRSQYASQIDKVTGQPGSGEKFLINHANPEFSGHSQSPQTNSSNPYAEQW